MNRLNYFLKTLFVVLLTASVVLFTGCSSDDGGDDTTTTDPTTTDPTTTDETTTDEDDEPTQTLLEIIQDDDNFTTLMSYVEDADDELDTDLEALLSGTTSHTFFAPTNAAFDDLEETLSAELDIVRSDIVEAVLLFHFSTTISDDATVAGETSLTSLQTEDIAIGSNGLFTTAGSSTDATVGNSTEATNGWVHEINKILIPPTIFDAIGLNLGKLAQPILLGKDFTVLAAAIAKSDTYANDNELLSFSDILTYEDNLSEDEGESDSLFTFFIPSDATFAAASVTVDTYDAATWYGILSNHIVVGTVETDDDGIITASELVNCDQFTSMADVSLQIFNNTDVVAADNGIGIYIDSDEDIDCALSDMGASLADGLDAEIVFQDDEDQATSNGAYIVIAGILAPPAPAE